MAYFMAAQCGSCGCIFTCNPHKVPSLKNIPFCLACVEAANVERRESGMSLIPIKGAYDPVREPTDEDWIEEYDDESIDGAM